MKAWQVVIAIFLSSSKVKSQEVTGGLLDNLIIAIDKNANNKIDHDEIADFFVGGKRGSVEIADKLVKMLDKNGDNEANKEELMNAAKKVVEFYIDTFDLNKDGALSQDEFVGNSIDVKGTVKNVEMAVQLLVRLTDVINKKVNDGLEVSEHNDDLDTSEDIEGSGDDGLPEEFKTVELFKKALDKNKDGKFSKEEIKDFANIAVNLVDINKDGKITKEELFETLERNYLPKKTVSFLRSQSNDKAAMDAWRDIFKEIDDIVVVQVDDRNNRDGKLGTEEIVPLLDTPILQLSTQMGPYLAPLVGSVAKDSPVTSEQLVACLKYFLQNKQFTSSVGISKANIGVVFTLVVASFL